MRIGSALVVACLSFHGLSAAAAQEVDPLRGAVAPEGEGRAAGQAADPEMALQGLFDTLRDSRSDADAKEIEQAIWSLWSHSGSDTVDLLMNWAAEALAGDDHALALKYLDSVVALEPGYAEGWNKRATVHFMMDDYGDAIADLGHVLSLEPRHFAALSGLGIILQEIGRKEQAMDAYRRALAIHPHLQDVQRSLDALAVEVDGRDI